MKLCLILAACAFIFLAFTSAALAQSSLRDAEKRTLDDILNPAKYDRRIRPNGENSSDPNGPVVTSINFFVRQIESFDDEKSQIKLQLTFRLLWKDPRLSFSESLTKLKYLSLRDASPVWVPDIFFSNELASSRRGALQPSTMVRIFPDGHVLYSSIVSLVLACPHDYSFYPFDKPECSVKIASYGYTTQDMILVWKSPDAIQVSSYLSGLGLRTESTQTQYCTSRTNSGEYSCLQGILKFRRTSQENLVRIYNPTILLVMISYLAFWLRKSNQRLVVTSLTLLIFIVHATLNQSSRPSHLVTVVDLWVGVCICFSFVSLVLTVWLDHTDREDTSNRVTSDDIEKVEQKEQLTDLIEEKAPPQSEKGTLLWLKKLKELKSAPRNEKNLLVLIRIGYPFVFLAFFLVYLIFIKRSG